MKNKHASKSSYLFSVGYGVHFGQLCESFNYNVGKLSSVAIIEVKLQQSLIFWKSIDSPAVRDWPCSHSAQISELMKGAISLPLWWPPLMNRWMSVFRYFLFLSFIVQCRSFEPFVAVDGRSGGVGTLWESCMSARNLDAEGEWITLPHSNYYYGTIEQSTYPPLVPVQLLIRQQQKAGCCAGKLLNVLMRAP